ncbi:hypothetical protein F503_02393 [Ophiostoma piceae UAMH 11346]|uniref:Dolichyl-diphosphooligosaccharide--protein glycosyltransferase subunit 4 n=1 Tax=Ophiostoma piceae (strain UAMH 11346) TaxID=1262450 RepID=S3CZA7_OPHP1|nr:hypothetical protein F503_02393 [Ophiostoma piceae UAMH 11346]
MTTQLCLTLNCRNTRSRDTLWVRCPETGESEALWTGHALHHVSRHNYTYRTSCDDVEAASLHHQLDSTLCSHHHHRSRRSTSRPTTPKTSAAPDLSFANSSPQHPDTCFVLLELADAFSSTLLDLPPYPVATMITDNQLYNLAVFLGISAMLLIVVYTFLEVNAIDEAPVPVTAAASEKKASK